MAARDEVGSLVAEKLVIGLSTIIGVTAVAGQNAGVLRYASGGSLEIGGSYSLVAGASTGFTWGNGYLMGTSEILNINISGNFQLAAMGATSIAYFLRGKTQGT